MQNILDTFTTLLKNPMNSKCVDCGSYNRISRCSLNNGVYLCADCAFVHEKVLSKDVSDIRMVPIILGKKNIPLEDDDRMKYLEGRQ